MAGIGSPVYMYIWEIRVRGSLFETSCIPSREEILIVARVAHPFERIIVEDPRLRSTILCRVTGYASSLSFLLFPSSSCLANGGLLSP